MSGPSPASDARVELEHGAAPEDAFELGAAEDEPGPAARQRTAWPERPAARHPQVGAEDDAAVEAQHEVLADRLDGLEPPAVELRGDVLRPCARMDRLDLELAGRREAGAAPRHDGACLPQAH